MSPAVPGALLRAAWVSHGHIYKPPGRRVVESTVFWLPFESCTG